MLSRTSNEHLAIKSELSKKTTSAAMEAREKKAIKHMTAEMMNGNDLVSEERQHRLR